MKETIFTNGDVFAHCGTNKGVHVCSKLDLPKSTMNVLNEACQNHEYNQHITSAIASAHATGVDTGMHIGLRNGTTKGFLIGTAATLVATAIGGAVYLCKKNSKKKESK
jgi:hypothetical protein